MPRNIRSCFSFPSAATHTVTPSRDHHTRAQKKTTHIHLSSRFLVKADGNITAWGEASEGGGSAPTDTGWRIPYGSDAVDLSADEQPFVITVTDVTGS